jgi:prepilin-type N-terminal cleavage/methylation domain-containing protein
MINLKKLQNQRGFTLIEMLVVIAIVSLLIFNISALTSSVLINSEQQLSSSANVDYAMNLSSAFTNEIRNASTGNNGSFSLNKAGDSEIIFYSTVGASGLNVNRIRYWLSETTLYKGVVAPTGSPLNYDLNSEKVTTVQTDLVNGATPVFYYYDGNYNGSTNQLAQPINVNQVKFVRINLIVLKQVSKNSTSNFTVSSGATIRNLKNNLGN